MRSNVFKPLAALSWLARNHFVAGANVHGSNAEGNVMGPVAFLWPSDRPWSASADNVAPCGSSDGVNNRTTFPLSQGSVALSIADDAWMVAFSIAYTDNPTSQDDFTQQVVNNVSEIEPGHQCYKVADIPDNVSAGTNATIQLEYWSSYESELSGRNQSFFACADITFVEASAFTVQVPCFNVTADEFTLTASSTSAVASATGESTAGTTESKSTSSGDGLSIGAKAGIAVGVIVASLGIVAAVAFVMLRKRKSRAPDQEVAEQNPKMPETSSVNSLRH
ncbi:uncharacterized protein BCR38DRAFT_380210 [Pseudomassariella vexata]|uniref:Copper acquisition factor BIM1-like domain-containing protein n=1 Tax=Pseudomassariella vexata TaxID=1141098 RepID=A0A1Y2D8D3_9PEZI|nr:uncharacterized protein BCR38DRAFT_380210 [Pseudomassariella vexata]ORY55477.1 hypothetical protein BCR38DRAFT_380210 [Pseudomassariella vexata]